MLVEELLDTTTDLLSDALNDKQAIVILLGGASALLAGEGQYVRRDTFHYLGRLPITNDVDHAINVAWQFLANRVRDYGTPLFWASEMLRLAHDIALHTPGWEDIVERFCEVKL